MNGSVSAMKTNNIRAVAFDADDTLWALQNHFLDVEREYCQLTFCKHSKTITT